MTRGWYPGHTKIRRLYVTNSYCLGVNDERSDYFLYRLLCWFILLYSPPIYVLPVDRQNPPTHPLLSYYDLPFPLVSFTLDLTLEWLFLYFKWSVFLVIFRVFTLSCHVNSRTFFTSTNLMCKIPSSLTSTSTSLFVSGLNLSGNLVQIVRLQPLWTEKN